MSQTTSFRMSAKLKDRWEDYLDENDTNKTDHITELIKESIAEGVSRDFDQILEEIEKNAEQDSYELLETDIPVKETDDGNQQFLKPQDFQERIDETQEKIAEIERELDELAEKKDTEILNSAVNGNVNQDELERIQSRKKELLDRKESLEDVLQKYEKAKTGAEEVEEDRKRLKKRLIANRMKDKIVDPVVNELDKKYTSFVSWFKKYLKARNKYASFVSGGTGNMYIGKGNYYTLEERLGDDLKVIDKPGRREATYDRDITEDHISRDLPIPPPDEVEDKTELSTSETG